MASNLEPKINRIATAVTSALSALTAKGVTVPEGANVESMAALIESIEAGGGADISPWVDMVTFSITPAEDLTGDIDFTSFIPGRTSFPHIFILGQRANTSGSPYVQSMARISTWNTWSRLYLAANSSNGNYPILSMVNGIFKLNIGSYKLEAGVPYWGVMLWH